MEQNEKDIESRGAERAKKKPQVFFIYKNDPEASKYRVSDRCQPHQHIYTHIYSNSIEQTRKAEPSISHCLFVKQKERKTDNLD